MPQQVDPLALAAAHGVPGRQIACLDDLAPGPGVGARRSHGPLLLRVCTDRTEDAALRLAASAASVQQLTMSSIVEFRTLMSAPQPRQVLPGDSGNGAMDNPGVSYQDILVDRSGDGIARVAINRPVSSAMPSVPQHGGGALRCLHAHSR